MTFTVSKIENGYLVTLTDQNRRPVYYAKSLTGVGKMIDKIQKAEAAKSAGSRFFNPASSASGAF